MTDTADVVIVGAGIMGCSSAFHLAGRGLRVTVVEKEGLGAGSTGRSSAIIRQHYSNELTARMALYSLRVFRDFEERVGDECGFRQTGCAWIVPASERPALEANMALQRRVGIDTRLLSPEELGELVPGLETGDLAAAAYEPESGYADPHLTVQAYAAAARRHGAEFMLGSQVTGIRLRAGRVVGVETTRGPIDAPVAVNCAGPWGATVAAMAGVEAPILPCRVQVAFFRRPSGFEDDHPIVADFVHGSYFRPELGGLTLVGSISPDEAVPVADPDDYAEHLEADFAEEIGRCWLDRYPPMERSRFTGGFAGLYGVTPDWHPVVDEVPAGSGSWLCAGFSGHGYKLGPAVGLMVADAITEEPQAEFPTHQFRLGRFAERDPIRGGYEYSIVG